MLHSTFDLSPDISCHPALLHLLFLRGLHASNFYFLSLLSATTQVKMAWVKNYFIQSQYLLISQFNLSRVITSAKFYHSPKSDIEFCLLGNQFWHWKYYSSHYSSQRSWDTHSWPSAPVRTKDINTSPPLTLDMDLACFWKTTSRLDFCFDSSSHRDVFLQAAFNIVLAEQMFSAQGNSYPLLTAVASEFRRMKVAWCDFMGGNKQVGNFKKVTELNSLHLFLCDTLLPNLMVLETLIYWQMFLLSTRLYLVWLLPDSDTLSEQEQDYSWCNKRGLYHQNEKKWLSSSAKQTGQVVSHHLMFIAHTGCAGRQKQKSSRDAIIQGTNDKIAAFFFFSFDRCQHQEKGQTSIPSTCNDMSRCQCFVF